MRPLLLHECQRSLSGRLISRPALHPRQQLQQQQQMVVSMVHSCPRVPHWSHSKRDTKSWSVSSPITSAWSPFCATIKDGANATSPGRSFFYGAERQEQAASSQATASTRPPLLNFQLLPLHRFRQNESSPTSPFLPCHPP